MIWLPLEILVGLGIRGLLLAAPVAVVALVFRAVRRRLRGRRMAVVQITM
jgi:hypothetical protein